MLAGFSHLSNGQEKELIPQGSNDTAKANKVDLLEQRLNDQQETLQVMKKENEVLKRQLQQVRNRIFNDRANNRVSVSRRGSKQVVVE